MNLAPITWEVQPDPNRFERLSLETVRNPAQLHNGAVGPLYLANVNRGDRAVFVKVSILPR